MLFLNFDWEMMTYWTIVGLTHAVRYQQEVRARDGNVIARFSPMVTPDAPELVSAIEAAL